MTTKSTIWSGSDFFSQSRWRTSRSVIDVFFVGPTDDPGATTASAQHGKKVS